MIKIISMLLMTAAFGMAASPCTSPLKVMKQQVVKSANSPFPFVLVVTVKFSGKYKIQPNHVSYGLIVYTNDAIERAEAEDGITFDAMPGRSNRMIQLRVRKDLDQGTFSLYTTNDSVKVVCVQDEQ